MALEKDVYKMLEEVVGPENLSQDPAILDCYRYCWGGEWMFDPKVRKFLPFRAGVAILPKSTEEVSKILKICNEKGLKYKAHGTGWLNTGMALTPDSVMIDLRRMNRILDIDEENMIAVIEPYVSGAQLLAEIWKKGMSFNIIGAGPNCSVLATITSVFGNGYNNLTMGVNERNSLGIEWVLPTGDVLRMGSLGSSGDWYTGDGPGPSLRGLMRGFWGTMGGLGVFTKAGIKLYQWPGEARLPLEQMETKPRKTVWLDDEKKSEELNIAVYLLYFPDLESRSEGVWKIGESEIGYSTAFFDRGLLPMFLHGYNKSRVCNIEAGIKEMLPEVPFALQLACNSKREFEYQKMVLKEILKETGGEIFPLEPEVEAEMLMVMAHGGNVPAKLVFGTSGSFIPLLSNSLLSKRVLEPMAKASIDIKRKWIKRGNLVDDNGEGGWGSMVDFSHMGIYENETLYNPHNPDSTQDVIDCSSELNAEMEKMNIEVSILGDKFSPATLKSLHDITGPQLSNYHLWQEKFKKALDPNETSESFTYG